jgi:hypothetical protein
MAAKRAKKFPSPRRPHSLRRMVKKLLADPDYARFIHRLVLKAREGDAAAAATVAAHFKPQAAELKALKVRPSDFGFGPRGCPTTTQTVLIDFAAYI